MNKMAEKPVGKLIWQMGLPMIASMVLQAVYNVVDTAFVVNMGEGGLDGNLALTFAFPVQLLIIALGVGTGVGINVLLSKSLGQGDEDKVAKVVGNGVFLAVVIYAVFLLFGVFGARAFVAMQAKGNAVAEEMGTQYLSICCVCSFGAVGFTVYERFLQASGKTGLSTVAQIAGALTNIVLDYVFIYPLKMGVAGAAWATVIGQVVSLLAAMAFHYTRNKEVASRLADVKPNGKVVCEIYSVGFVAAVMQGLLSVMMLVVNLVLANAPQNAELLVGSFGIYYKIQQFALFACFGLSNTLISVVAFNYGAKNGTRVVSSVKWGLVDAVAVAAVVTCLFQIFAKPLASAFNVGGGSADLSETCVRAVRVATIGYVFMGFSVAAQGVLQAFGYAVFPLVISALRLVVFIAPLAYLFSRAEDATQAFWWTFPLSEALTAVFSAVFLLSAYRKKIKPLL